MRTYNQKVKVVEQIEALMAAGSGMHKSCKKVGVAPITFKQYKDVISKTPREKNVQVIVHNSEPAFPKQVAPKQRPIYIITTTSDIQSLLSGLNA